MIYATIKPIEEYDVTLDTGEVFGIHQSYGHIPPLLALIVLGTPLAYHYEGNKPKEKRQVTITNIDAFKTTLGEKIGSQFVETLLVKMNPLEFYEEISDFELSHLTVVQEIYSGDQAPFKAIVGARAAAWGLNYKGKISSEGNITKVSFGGSKTGMKVPEELVMLHAGMRKGFGT